MFIVVVVVGGGLAALITAGFLDYYERERERRQTETTAELAMAKQMLLSYLLFRADERLKIAAGSALSINPRWLMLPCPDNLGDKNLDGSQDPTCGGKPSSAVNVVNGALGSGSRFGRLPWNRRSLVKAKKGSKDVHRSINDGLGRDFRDGNGNRLWYALSRNMAPTLKDDNIPLNLHQLATQKDHWLKVVDAKGRTLSAKTAAVILAPRRGRQAESKLSRGTYRYPKDVTGVGAVLAPANFFESVALPTAVQSNADLDGVFVQAKKTETFNDGVAYIDIDELVNPAGYFLRTYRRVVGVGDTQNQPLANRPLEHIRNAVHAYYRLFDFYPVPANATVTAHVNGRERHCAEYHSGTVAVTAVADVGITLVAPAPLSISASSSAAEVTVSGDFLLAAPVALTVTATVTQKDEHTAVALFTLARHARARFHDATVMPLQAASLDEIAAGASVRLHSPATVIVAASTPLSPFGDLQGWLPENRKPPSANAGVDGRSYRLAADTRAAFLTGATLTTAAASLTVTADDRIVFPVTHFIQLEEDYDQLKSFSGTLYYQTGGKKALMNVKPTASSYFRRQLAVRLLSDATYKSKTGETRKTIYAPAVLFPWRQVMYGDTFRDNRHDYPPCFDARNFYGDRLHLFLQDQPMIYAVAATCHYGGDPAVCGKTAGLTVSIAAGATVALPQALTLKHDLTLTFGDRRLTLVAGEVKNKTPITVTKTTKLPIVAAAATLGFIRLSAGFVFSPATTVVATAGALLIGGAGAVIRHVPALLIYSPSPLPRTRCVSGMPDVNVVTAAAVTLANQRQTAAAATAPCRWLDDDENADGDGLFVIYPPSDDSAASPRNDFFILFGGRLRLS